MGLKLKIAGKSDKGMKRKNNEDAFVVDSNLGFMIVADGMGGHASGEVASKLATELTSQQLKRALQTGHVPVFFHVPDTPNLDKRSLLLGDCIKFSNQAVYEAAQSNPANHNMGTTIVAALWLDDRLAVAHVGDSRLYTYHDGKLRQWTVDHSFVQEQIERGLLSPEEAENSEMKNMLTRSVGISEDVQVDVTEIKPEEGDYVLLCSDGLTKMLTHEQMESVFKSETEPERIVDQLITKANQAGGGDNVTAVVAQVENGSKGSLADRVKGLFKKAS